MNDEINKLIREKSHWERRIVELGGPDYSRAAPRTTDSMGREVAELTGTVASRVDACMAPCSHRMGPAMQLRDAILRPSALPPRCRQERWLPIFWGRQDASRCEGAV